MKRYERYKPSGVEWIGEIPDHWGLKKFGLISYMKGRIGWQGLRQAEFTNEGPYLITGMNFENGRIAWDKVYHISEERYNEAPEIQIKTNDVLMTKDGTIGKLLYIDYLPGPASLNSHLLVFRPHENLYHPKYLFYQLQSLPFKHFIGLNKSGTTFFGITQDAVSRYMTILPAYDEQMTIFRYLDRKTAQIDDIIAKKQRLIDLLNEEKTAIINQAVTKGLDPNTPMKDSGIPWLGEIPTHWEIKKIKYIANLTLGKMLTGEDKGGNFLKPYLRAQNISWFKCDTSDVKEMWFSQSELIKYRVNLNDLLVSEGGDVGRTCIWMNELDECYIQNSVHKITFKKYFNPKYFLYLFYCFGRKGYFLSIVNQISIGHLTGEKLKEVFTIFPGFDEQTAIVDYLDRKTDQMDDVISKTHHEIELLQEYRTALISEAVTGKIDVRI